MRKNKLFGRNSPSKVTNINRSALGKPEKIYQPVVD